MPFMPLKLYNICFMSLLGLSICTRHGGEPGQVCVRVGKPPAACMHVASNLDWREQRHRDSARCVVLLKVLRWAHVHQHISVCLRLSN